MRWKKRSTVDGAMHDRSVCCKRDQEYRSYGYRRWVPLFGLGIMRDALLQEQYCCKAESFNEKSESLWLFVESFVSSFDKRVHTME